MFTCDFCHKICKNKNSYSNHKRLCKNNPNRQHTWLEENPLKGRPLKGHVGTNQFIKARQLNKPIPKVSEETRKKLSVAQTGRVHSEETKRKISESVKRAVLLNPESYSSNNVSGRVKMYEYNGMKFKGKWELLVAEKLFNENIKYTNIVSPIDYEWNGSIHKYFPDFYLEEYDLYIEVKGYQRDRDVAKWNSLDNLLVFKKQEIKRLTNESIKNIIHDMLGRSNNG